MICNNCGYMHYDEKVCPYCGTPVDVSSSVVVAEEETVTVTDTETVGYTGGAVADTFTDTEVFANPEKVTDTDAVTDAEKEDEKADNGEVSSSPFVPRREPLYVDADTNVQSEDDWNTIDNDESDTATGEMSPTMRRNLSIAICVVFVIITVVVISSMTRSQYREKRNMYGIAMGYYKSEQYEQAYEAFSELGTYKDSQEYANRSLVYSDYNNIRIFEENGDYDKIITTLGLYVKYCNDSREEKKINDLILEYKKVKYGYEHKNNGNYSSAQTSFGSLKALKNRYEIEYAICGAYAAVDSEDWPLALLYLYGIRIEDYKVEYVSAPESDLAWNIVSLANSNPRDYSKVDEIAREMDKLMESAPKEQRNLYSGAINELKYEYAVGLFDDGDYESAMKVFEELGDFRDSQFKYSTCEEYISDKETKYTLAQWYYDNGEYYKAKEAWESIPGYEDSDEKAKSCMQPMPENDSMKFDQDGSSDLTLYAPEDLAVLFRVYDSDGNLVAQVFIGVGESVVLELDPGSYEMHYAMGSEWYGEKEMFGPNGYYRRAYVNNGNFIITLDSGTEYTFYLRLTFPFENCIITEGPDGV